MFSKYLFAKPLTGASAQKVATELATIFFTHSYIPHTIVSDLGTNFVSELMHELCKLLEIKLKHATLKHAQTVGVVERSHAALKRILKLNTDEQWSKWHLYVPLATFIHNTSYYSSIGCTPTAIFHGREPIKALDIRFNNKNIQLMDPKSDFVTELQDAMQILFSQNKCKLVEAYHKFRKYYDEKAYANPLQEHSYCLLLNPKLSHQSDFGSKSMQIWLPLYRVERVLTNSNYLIRKIGTNFTQCVHRVRLRTYEPSEPPIDIQDVSEEKFTQDLSLGKYRQEPELFDNEIPNLLNHNFMDEAHQSDKSLISEDPVTVTYQSPVAARLAPQPRPAPVAPAAAPIEIEPQEPIEVVEHPQPVQNDQVHEPENILPNVVFPFIEFPEIERQRPNRVNTNNLAFNENANEQTNNFPNETRKTAPTPRHSQNKHVQFSPTSQIPAPEKQTRAKPRQFVTIDGKILTPINLSPGAKKDNIKKSYRSNMERTIFHPGAGPSRATKMDQKRSEEVKNTRQDTEFSLASLASPALRTQ